MTVFTEFRECPSALYLPTTDVMQFCLHKLTIQLTCLIIVSLLVVYFATVN